MSASREFITAHLDPLDAVRQVGQSDFDLNPEFRPSDTRPLRPAAVLAPLVEREEGLTVLLTRRADSMRTHQGQVAFPGGRVDPGETLVEAALREAEEEINLSRDFVTPVGLLTPYETVTGYCVTPVVGFVRPGFELVLNAHEVAAVFEAPFDWLMDAANHQRHWREPVGGGLRRHFYAMPFGEHYIWGATAGMLRGFHERLYGTS